MEEEFKLIMREPEFQKIGFQEGNIFFNQLFIKLRYLNRCLKDSTYHAKLII